MSNDLNLALRFRAEGARAAQGEVDRLAGGVRQTGQESQRAQPQAERLQQSVGRLRQSALRATVALAGGAGLVAGIRSAVNTTVEFESQMARVQAVTGATGSDFRALSDQAKQLGSETQFSATQAAEGIEFLGRAGFETTEIVSALPSVLDLATAAAMDLGSAADITSNIMSAFGVEASRSAEIADALTSASQNANTDVRQLGDAMSFVGPVAASLGISMQDAAGAIGVLSDAGIQGSAAGTGLRRVLSSLANPTDEAKRRLRDMGLTLEAVNPQTNSLQDVIARLGDAGLETADAMQIFGDRGGPAILSLTRNVDGLEDLTRTINDSAGAAKDAAEIMRDTLRGDVDQLRAAFEGLSISLGEAGVTSVLRGLTQALTGVVRFISDLPQPLQSAAVAAGALGTALLALSAAKAALAPVMGAVVSRSAATTTALGTQTSATTAATAATRLFSVALRAVPILGAVAVITELASAYGNLRRVQQEAAEAQERANTQLREGIDAARENAAANVQGASGAKAAIDAVANGVENLTDSQRQFYRSNLAEAEEYLQAQIAIGVREQELHGETQVELGKVGEQLRAVRAAQQELGVAVDENADQFLDLNQQLDRLADKAPTLAEQFRGLGDDISNVSSNKLQEFADRARANLGEAQQAVADVRAEFPNLQNVSDEALARVDDGFRQAIGRVEELNGIINTVSEEALRRLGVDASEVMTGVRSEVREAIDAFDALAADATTDARLIEAAYDSVLRRLDSPAELEEFRGSLERAQRAGFDVRDALEAVDVQLKETQQSASEHGEEVAGVTDEYGRMGDAADDAGKRAADSHRQAAGAARDQAQAVREISDAQATLGGATTVGGRDGDSDRPSGIELGGVETQILDPSVAGLLSREQQEQLLAEAQARLRRHGDNFNVRGATGARLFGRQQQAIIDDVNRRAADLAGISSSPTDSEIQNRFRGPDTQITRRTVDVNLNLGGERVTVQAPEDEADRLLRILENARAVSAAGA